MMVTMMMVMVVMMIVPLMMVMVMMKRVRVPAASGGAEIVNMFRRFLPGQQGKSGIQTFAGFLHMPCSMAKFLAYGGISVALCALGPFFQFTGMFDIVGHKVRKQDGQLFPRGFFMIFCHGRLQSW
jgi:hypothetical protein